MQETRKEIDDYQQRLQDGLSRIKKVMKDIDMVTDIIQRPKTTW